MHDLHIQLLVPVGASSLKKWLLMMARKYQDVLLAQLLGKKANLNGSFLLGVLNTTLIYLGYLLSLQPESCNEPAKMFLKWKPLQLEATPETK